MPSGPQVLLEPRQPLWRRVLRPFGVKPVRYGARDWPMNGVPLPSGRQLRQPALDDAYRTQSLWRRYLARLIGTTARPGRPILGAGSHEPTGGPRRYDRPRHLAPSQRYRGDFSAPGVAELPAEADRGHYGHQRGGDDDGFVS